MKPRVATIPNVGGPCSVEGFRRRKRTVTSVPAVNTCPSARNSTRSPVGPCQTAAPTKALELTWTGSCDVDEVFEPCNPVIEIAPGACRSTFIWK
eukprot:2548497-Rhodomonas_salina.1